MDPRAGGIGARPLVDQPEGWSEGQPDRPLLGRSVGQAVAPRPSGNVPRRPANPGRPASGRPQHARSAREDGVAANARLTGSTGAILLVLLAIEGVTLLRIRAQLGLHVIIGSVIVPVVALKLATTTWRFARYYAGDGRYRRKGPPPPLLRMLGPVVGATTVALLATGFGALLLAPGAWRSRMLLLHKGSFVVWFGAMTIHVLGHLFETSRLAAADWLPSKLRDRLGRHKPANVLGVGIRRTVLVITLLLGVVLAIALSGRAAPWLAGVAPHHP